MSFNINNSSDDLFSSQIHRTGGPFTATFETADIPKPKDNDNIYEKKQEEPKFILQTPNEPPPLLGIRQFENEIQQPTFIQNNKNYIIVGVLALALYYYYK